MKADFSNWSHKPENPTLLRAYAENALLEGATRGIVPVVVWRDGEATLTLTPQEGEQIYDFGIVDRRVVEIPEEVLEALEAYDDAVTAEEEVIQSSQESQTKGSKL
jgi:hypothetical protein